MQINAQIQTCNFESLGLKLFDENIAKNYIQYVLSRICIIKQEQQSKIGDSYKTNLKKQIVSFGMEFIATVLLVAVHKSSVAAL